MINFLVCICDYLLIGMLMGKILLKGLGYYFVLFCEIFNEKWKILTKYIHPIAFLKIVVFCLS